MAAKQNKATPIRSIRRSQGLCPRCGAIPQKGRVYCPTCNECHRLRNRAYHKRLQESGRQRTIEQRRELEAAERNWKHNVLHNLAGRLGRVPTIKECNEALGRPAEDGRSSPIRRSAFNLRPLTPEETRTVIPYPVPAKFQ